MFSSPSYAILPFIRQVTFIDKEDVLAMESKGRIEVAPEVITAIAHQVIRKIDGVVKMGTPPSSIFRRTSAHTEGIALHDEDGKLVFDVYVHLSSDVNLQETSKTIQSAVIESMDHMVGVPVEAIHIHVEDVVY